MRTVYPRRISALTAVLIFLLSFSTLPIASAASCPSGTYKNTAGNCVQRPTQAPSWPTGASAKCFDGTYSFSQSRRGTCSHHGGVAKWR